MRTPSSEIVVSIHQPNYMPWLGYFYKIYKSDFFVFLDDVQFSSEGMHNYTYIKTTKGPFRLKYPVWQNFGDQIVEVRSKDHLEWKTKHLHLIESNYKSARYFNLVFNDYKSVLLADYHNIVNLNTALITLFVSKLGFNARFLYSSEFNILQMKSNKIIAICKTLGAGIYYSGTGAKAYQNEDHFLLSGITIEYSDFTPFQYPQLWGGFQQNVSALDFFMNCGYDWELVLQNQNRG